MSVVRDRLLVDKEIVINRKDVQMNIVEIRKNGIGSNFSVVNPHDGYRKDNRLWFGECSECGEMVSSSSMSAKSVGWTHTLTKKISETGFQMTSIDYCPKA